MMLYRLVRLIETHSKALAACLLARVQISEATPDYRNVPPEELKARVYEIYSHLGDWLVNRDEFDLEQRYLKIGARRAQQNVPLSQVAWAITLTKDNLWEFLKRESEAGTPRRNTRRTGDAANVEPLLRSRDLLCGRGLRAGGCRS